LVQKKYQLWKRECICRALKCYEQGFFFDKTNCTCPTNSTQKCLLNKCVCKKPPHPQRFHGNYTFGGLISENDNKTTSYLYRRILISITVNGTTQQRTAYVNDNTGSFYTVKPQENMTQQQQDQETTNFSNPSNPSFSTVQAQIASNAYRIILSSIVLIICAFLYIF